MIDKLQGKLENIYFGTEFRTLLGRTIELNLDKTGGYGAYI